MTRSFTPILASLALACCLALALPAFAAGPDDLALRGLDRELYRFAEVIPGFGGLFFDQEGHPNVYLLEPAAGTALQRINPDINILQGEFEYRELAVWRAGLRSVLSFPGVVFLDLDERSNRVRIGVESVSRGGPLDAIRQELGLRGVPDRAVIVEQTDPIHHMVTLRDRVRPVPGSMQIHFSNFLCTLTFNADRSGVRGHLMNSHCTDQQGGVESTEYFQPTSSVDPVRISVEIADPEYFRGGECPRGRKCRYSDSAFADYDSDSTGEFGKIARTTFRDPLEGSITIDDNDPRFSVTGEFDGDPAAGTELNKVGRTTGWTFGDVDSSCVDVNVFGSNITQLCQTIVLAGVGGGDSGSPVFSWDGASSVTLYGILWGGNNAGTLFVYSPMHGIERELGTLTTH